MQAGSVVTCLWPGLPQLWWRGDWRGLVTAVSFALAVNLGLLAGFVWPGWFPGWAVTAGWIAALGYWLASIWHGHRWLTDFRGKSQNPAREGLFVQAQTEYLRGHWLEAETLLKRLVAESASDAEAHLILATLYRRTRRFVEAEAVLEKLECTDAARPWLIEIRRERRRTEQAQTEQAALAGKASGPAPTATDADSEVQ
jgi:hypothetical protein